MNNNYQVKKNRKETKGESSHRNKRALNGDHIPQILFVQWKRQLIFEPCNNIFPGVIFWMPH